MIFNNFFCLPVGHIFCLTKSERKLFYIETILRYWRRQATGWVLLYFENLSYSVGPVLPTSNNVHSSSLNMILYWLGSTWDSFRAMNIIVIPIVKG